MNLAISGELNSVGIMGCRNNQQSLSNSLLVISVVVETFPSPFRDLSTCLNLEIVRYIKIPTTEAIESNNLNIKN